MKSFENDDEIIRWSDSLDERWPERESIRKHVLEKLGSLCCRQARIVELCCGDGRLAREILTAVPDADYVGVDGSRSLCEYVRRSLSVRTIEADLSKAGWSSSIEGPVDAVVSIQSLHDVGDGCVISQVYRESLDLLSPDGVLLIADFAPDTFDPDRPGRLSSSWHAQQLQDSGYTDVHRSLESGDISCFSASKPSP